MLTPVKLLLLGVAVFVVGVVFGSFGVDPLSAWIGTVGMVMAGAAVVWLLVERFRSRGNA